jgi:hypothetical protein
MMNFHACPECHFVKRHLFWVNVVFESIVLKVVKLSVAAPNVFKVSVAFKFILLLSGIMKNFIMLNTNIYSYLETSGGQSSNPCLNAVHF